MLLSFFFDLATLFSNTFKVKGKFHQEYKLYQIDKKKVWLASMLPKLTRSYFKLLDMIHPLLVIYSEVIIRHLMLYACKKTVDYGKGTVMCNCQI